MSLGCLSPRVSLEQSRKQAKDLLRAFKAGDARAGGCPWLVERSGLGQDMLIASGSR